MLLSLTLLKVSYISTESKQLTNNDFRKEQVTAMLHKIAKKLTGRRPATMRVTDYYKIINHVEAQIKEAIIVTILGIVMVVAIVICLNHDTGTGYWAADYMDENGVLYDTDGDGDYYHWVEE